MNIHEVHVHPLPPIPVKKWIDEYFSEQDFKTSTTLCAIMTSFGSDKGDGRHNYTTLYSKLFSPWRNEKICLFELGIGTNFTDIPSNMGAAGTPGASLFGWSLYFPNAQIFGADIDRRILFNEKNIHTYYCDQREEKSIHALFSNEDLKDLKFDIIIDDGLHEFEASLNFLKPSIQKLKKGGIYITEDLDPSSRAAFAKILPALREFLSVEFIDTLNIPYPLNRFDNSLLIIQK